MGEVDRISQFPRSGEAIGFKIIEVDFEGFKFRKLFRQACGLVNTLSFTQAVFRARIGFPRRHIHRMSSADEEKAICETPAKSWSKTEESNPLKARAQGLAPVF